MSIKEDILEQLVDDWLQAKGYFTRHNLKFKPGSHTPGHDVRRDAVASDIDVLGLHPARLDSERVQVVSYKSWQGGFSPASWIDRFAGSKTVFGKDAWKAFRELAHPRWSRAFVDAVEAATGSRRFTYVTAVTRLRGDRAVWESHGPFLDAMEGNPVRIVTLREMAAEVTGGLTTTVASSQLGRTLQLLKASGFDLSDRG